MGEASEMSSMSEVSTADTAKGGGGGGGGSKAKILVPVVVVLVVLSVIGAVIITGAQEDPGNKSSESGEEASSGGGSGGGGSSSDDTETKKPPFSGPHKVLFCFIGGKDVSSDLEKETFPDDNLCTHLILQCASTVEAQQDFDIANRCLYIKRTMDKLLEERYKKTEGGMSVRGEDFKESEQRSVGVVIGASNVKKYMDTKYLHFGMHSWLTTFTEEKFKTTYMPYLKSIHDYHKQANPDRMAPEASDPLYGFVGFQITPYNKDGVLAAAKAMEDALGFGVLFIIHTNFELRNDDTECVYGGTPLNLPETCKKPSFSDYVAMQDKLAFTKGSKVAAVFDMAVVETKLDEEPTANKFSEMKKPLQTPCTLKEFRDACDGTPVTTEAGKAAITGKVKGKTVYAYDDETTWDSKMKKIQSKTAPHHLGFAVDRVEYDAWGCDDKRSYKRLGTFKSASGISRQ